MEAIRFSGPVNHPALVASANGSIIPTASAADLDFVNSSRGSSPGSMEAGVIPVAASSLVPAARHVSDFPQTSQLPNLKIMCRHVPGPLSKPFLGRFLNTRFAPHRFIVASKPNHA
jgi:hypothetical protein